MKTAPKISVFFMSALLSIIINASASATAARFAVITVPVAEMVGNPLKNDTKTESSKPEYDNIPFCGGPIPRCYLNCPRLHQGLFNEVVQIKQEKDDQVEVALSNVFYVDALGVKHNRFWTHKTNLIPLKQLEQHGCSTEYIPSSLNASWHHASLPIVVLENPWHDTLSNHTFSAGTRFVTAPEQRTNRTFEVMILNPNTYTYYQASIPKKLCASHSEHKKEQIKQYVTLVKNWAQHNQGASIPYVFGGCSFTAKTNAPFKSHTVVNKNEKSFFYTIGDENGPKTGLDCSGLIVRAAQIYGIPYFFKNTTTIAAYLKPLGQHSLQNGDLFLIKGHVMIVSDIKNNLLIEARAYDHGYGKLHEIEIGKVFQHIHTYTDLIAAYKSHKPLTRLDAQGAVCSDPIKEWQLLRFESVWE